MSGKATCPSPDVVLKIMRVTTPPLAERGAQFKIRACHDTA
jgi:hypothetical protein